MTSYETFYNMNSRLLFHSFLAYERIVNSCDIFAGFRVNIFAGFGRVVIRRADWTLGRGDARRGLLFKYEKAKERVISIPGFRIPTGIYGALDLAFRGWSKTPLHPASTTLRSRVLERLTLLCVGYRCPSNKPSGRY